MQRIIHLALFLLMLSLISLQPGEPVLAWQEATNLLENPGFEGSFFAWSGINEVQVAHAWTPWWRERRESDPPATYFRPEYKQANGYIFPNRVHNGAAAQQWFTFHATHQAGMYQQVFGVTPGTRYRFSVWAQVWSSTEDDPNASVNPAYPSLQVGIDPTGNWNPWAGTVIWSGTAAFYDSWGQLAVEAVAQADIITVFMRSEPNAPVKHNDTYWDDAALVAISGNGVPSPPTATPGGPEPPTATAAASPSPMPTCSQAPSDWVTYHVRRGDTLFSLAKSRGTTLDRVISVNCLSTVDIYVGQALWLPPLPATATPSGATGTPTRVQATSTVRPTKTHTKTPAATPTEVTMTPTKIPVTPTPTAVPATATSISVASVTASPTKPRPTIPPPLTSTPGSPAPPPTSTASGDATRPCGTVVVGAGFVLLAGVFKFRRRRESEGYD